MTARKGQKNQPTTNKGHFALKEGEEAKTDAGMTSADIGAGRGIYDAPASAAARVDEALKEWLPEKDDLQCAARDMMTDLHHWADAHGVDMFEAMDGYYDVYLYEKRNPHL